MLPAKVQLQLIGSFPRRITEGECLELVVRDLSPIGSLFPWWIQYKLFIIDGHNRTVWVQSDVFDLEEHSRIEFFMPEEFIRYIVAQQDRRFRLGVIALDSRYGSRPVTSTTTMSTPMWLRSLEEAAADQVAEQMAHDRAAAVAAGALPPDALGEARPIVAQVSGSRSGDRHDEEDESMSDDSGSELPQAPLPTGNAGPLPRTFDEFRRHWGTRLKDVAAHYGVPESGLSKGWKRACARYFSRNTKLPRWPVTDERIREMERILLQGKR